MCVFDITYSPHTQLHPPGVHSPIIWLVGGPRLHVSRLFPGDTVCVCVCMFDIACSSHPALHLPDAHSPLICLVGGHANMCRYCDRSLPEVPSALCVTRDTVCLFVYVGHCMLPPPPTAYSQCSWPINLISGGPRQHV